MLAKLEPYNISKNLLKEICQIIFSFYQVKETSKKVYNNEFDYHGI